MLALFVGWRRNGSRDSFEANESVQVLHPRVMAQSVVAVCAGLVLASGCGDDGGGQSVQPPTEDAGTSLDASPSQWRDAEASDAQTSSTSSEDDVDSGGGSTTTATSVGVESTTGAPTSHTVSSESGELGSSVTSPVPTHTSGDAPTDGATSNDPSNEATTEPNDASTNVETSVASDTGNPPVPADRWTQGEALFNHDGIVEIDIQLPEESVSGLHADPGTYVHGALHIALADGTEQDLGDVGVRLKGRYGSARTLDQKSSFLLKANEYVNGQRLFGSNKIAINNLVQDPSMLHEQLAYELFRAMGVPAPRTGYARVTVNGELKGLYATIEVVDNAPFLDHWFANSDGNLYEGSYGSDLEASLISSFDQDRGADVGFGDLTELAAALDQMTTAETFVTDVEAWINLDAYVKFAATELFLSHWDGYAATRNNYFVYRPLGGQWYWIPWGTDQTFGDVGASVWNGNGRLQQMCEASVECRQKLASAYAQLIGLVAQLDLLGEVDELETLISDAVAEDTAKEYDTDSVHYAIEELRGYLNGRGSVVASDLRCINPSNVDEDEDGASGCGEDCNDWDPAVYPGAYEECNLIDDDCSGHVDDANGCPQCVNRTDDNGDDYAFCFPRVTYWAAQAECENLGGGLVSIHDQYQHNWLSDTAASLNVGDEWWIGLDDTYEEGVFRWNDGSTVDYTNWNTGEPNDWGGNEDCGELTRGIWNDLPCDYSIGYICAL